MHGRQNSASFQGVDVAPTVEPEAIAPVEPLNSDSDAISAARQEFLRMWPLAAENR